MTTDRSTVVFFDASCLVAAAGSPTGGASFIISLCARRLLSGAVSQPVLQEAARNIEGKLRPSALVRYYHLLVETPLLVAPVPEARERAAYTAIVGEKDDHVLAAALAVRAPFLLTLDKRFANRVNEADLPVLALSPGDFIRGVLPAHAEFPELRADDGGTS